MAAANDDLIGLLLMGGQSTRMGTDKSRLVYRDKPHAQYLFELLKDQISPSYVSLRSGQTCDFTSAIIVDSCTAKGPMNGILSAMHRHPQHALLVLATDLPHIQSRTIRHLIDQRDPQHMVTAYCSVTTGLPEPLIAIWEPAARAGLEAAQKNKQYSLQAFMNTVSVKCVAPESEKELFNANTPSEYARAKKKMASQPFQNDQNR